MHGGNLKLFYVNLSVTRFLVNDQRDAQIPFYVFIFIFNCLHVSSRSCSSSGETNCVNKQELITKYRNLFCAYIESIDFELLQ
jgi:hypothetical protein